ncbi:hypothetical protein [Beijerinckia mobilis]|uniref:hypothetical protein n=1 Tax=Beijerinckia mobilis TaxID=231434 RepID=UPI000557FEFE|nr:hypothetical protein [Beijerinckia mobilis]
MMQGQQYSLESTIEASKVEAGTVEAGKQAEELQKQTYAFPAAGPHARHELINFDATPGTGILSGDRSPDQGDEVDGAAG